MSNIRHSALTCDYGNECFQVAAALIPLSQALYANGDLDPARESCTRALKILQMAYGQNPTVEVSKEAHAHSVEGVPVGQPRLRVQLRRLRCC